MPPGPPPGFSKNVFINCPFDSEYNSLLRPILFTIIYLGCVDAKSHANQPNKAVLALRNWFVDTVHLTAADSPTVIWYRFMDFNTDFYERRKAEGFSRGDLKMMPVSEY